MEAFLERKPIHHPQVISRAVDDETLLLKLDTGQVSVLNEVGGQIWDLMDGQRPLGDIIQAVGEQYGVERQRVESDVRAFVGALFDRDMLSWGSAEG